ncbi:MAG: dihydropteroate synthase [Acidobacteria bacterium RIFCSPLOWO2_12_FULL_67_14b]|nr:MAG: dihydropteroate synthase [Acidobacteria bacterium RIFCSPLOWO2_12_FULL_67_14b]
MGVINATPDSFSDGGAALDAAAALDIALAMEASGADLIDVGAESTRPGATPVGTAEESARVRPVLRAMAGKVRIPISIDTYKAEVAALALDEGAAIVNDISGLTYDPALGAVVAARGVPVILMHTRGRPADMYAHAEYVDVVGEVAADLQRSVDRALAAGVERDAILLDPGLGFAKRAEQSLQALAGIERLAALGFPIVVGPSRKSFMTAATGPLDPDARDWPTAAAVTAAVLGGAHIVRVHRVAEMVQVVRLADAIRNAAVATNL